MRTWKPCMPLVANPSIDRLPIKPPTPSRPRTADAHRDGGRPGSLRHRSADIAASLTANRSDRRSLAVDQSEHDGRRQARRDSNRYCVFGRSMLSACLVIVVAATVVHADEEPPAHPKNAPAPSNPWSHQIAEAAERFAIPEHLIGAVIRAESAGDVHAVSPKGAMGLMQIMPATWSELRARYDLGCDPFLPQDNILAGAAYLREMLDRFGPDGFLAAYHAGPARYEVHLATGRPLPAETIAYVSKLAPVIHVSSVSLTSRRQLADTSDALHSPLFPQIGGISVNDPLQEERATADGIFVPLRPAASPSRQAAVSDPPVRPSLPDTSPADNSLSSTPAASSRFVSRSSAAPR